MLNASLTFMFSSITWLFWGRGAGWFLTIPISSGRLQNHKRQPGPPPLLYKGNYLLGHSVLTPDSSEGWSSKYNWRARVRERRGWWEEKGADLRQYNTHANQCVYLLQWEETVAEGG